MVSIEQLDLNLLLTLHHVLATGSVVGAARRLHVTPSAVSNALARLRAQLDDPLLVRTGRGLTPTPLAQALAPRLAAALGELGRALEATAFDPATTERTFVIAAADNLGFHLLPALLAHLAAAMPRAGLRVVSLDHAIAFEGLATGAVDLSIGIPPPEAGLRTAPAYREKLLCVGYRPAWADVDDLTLDRFLAARHIQVALGGQFPIDVIDGPLATKGRARDVVLSVPQFASAAACLVRSPYLAVLPARMTAALRDTFDLVTWEPPVALPEVALLQVWHDRTEDDPGCRLLRSLVAEAWGG